MIMNIPGYTGTSGGLSSGGLNLPGYTGQSGGLSGGGLNIPTMGNANISPQLAAANPTGFQQFLTGAGNVLDDIFGGVQQIGSAISPAMPAIAGSLLTKEAYDRLSNVGDTAYQRSMDLAERGQQESQFRPFTVTTPTGSAFTARMGGQPQPPMMTGGPVPPPPMMTGGPVSPGFTPVLRPMPNTFQPGTVMDAGGAFGSGQGRPAGMPRFAGSPDSQPAADAMARQYQQPTPQPQGGLEIGMSLSPEENLCTKDCLVVQGSSSVRLNSPQQDVSKKSLTV